jgi:hypothetical protein
VIVGCAMPEYEQGMNVARIGVLLAGLPNSVAGMTDQPLLLVGPATPWRSPPTASARAKPT